MSDDKVVDIKERLQAKVTQEVLIGTVEESIREQQGRLIDILAPAIQAMREAGATESTIALVLWGAARVISEQKGQEQG